MTQYTDMLQRILSTAAPLMPAQGESRSRLYSLAVTKEDIEALEWLVCYFEMKREEKE